METSKAFTSSEPNVLKGVLSVLNYSPLCSQQEGFSWSIRAKQLSAAHDVSQHDPGPTLIYPGPSYSKMMLLLSQSLQSGVAPRPT